MENVQATTAIITKEQLQSHWRGHRGLTRRVIEAFPEKELFEFSVGGMRPFAQQMMEVIDLTGPGIKGLATGDWGDGNLPHFTGVDMPTTKEELLTLWDEASNQLKVYWPQIAPEDFNKEIKAFGQYEGTILSTLLYFIDNEIHHRAQGYVYLRALGIEPPFFWDRK
ncbi:DinB family protein [Flavobacterium sp. RHBU_3]|uniref:DinB family protein n=1 Tax=Flavobacterium sp. RHBU_3 TaxID=3391184 RepID=UPI0039853B47